MEQFVETFFQDHGLIALFALMILDNVGVPIPSEIPLLLAGFSVHLGSMGFPQAVLVAAAGSLVGALVLYVAGRSVGRAVVVRWGRLLRVTHDDLDRAEAWFRRRGEAAVFFLRVVPLARTWISVPAGMLTMSPVRFTTYTFTGSVLWSMIVIGAGWGLGSNYRSAVDRFGLASIIAASVIAMLAVIWFIRRSSSRPQAGEDPATRG